MPEEPTERSAAPVTPKAILRARARALARTWSEEEREPAGREVLEFTVAGDRYALPLASLREIHLVRKLAGLPGTPDFVRGLVVVRGQLVSVLDLRVLLGLSRSDIAPESSALVLENETMTFSILADQVGEIRFLPDKDLEAGAPSLEALDRRYIAGVTRDCAILLDAEKLLSDPALVVNG